MVLGGQCFSNGGFQGGAWDFKGVHRSCMRCQEAGGLGFSPTPQPPDQLEVLPSPVLFAQLLGRISFEE